MSYKLQSFALDMFDTDKIQHTYVKDSDGKTWPCWGRDSEGDIIVDATRANSKNADDLGESWGKYFQSGILYGITGVCHQTANRILFAADEQVTVKEAGGYVLSEEIYGTFGTNKLLEGVRRVMKKSHVDKSWVTFYDILTSQVKSWDDLRDMWDIEDKSYGRDSKMSDSFIEELSGQTIKLLSGDRDVTEYTTSMAQLISNEINVEGLIDLKAFQTSLNLVQDN